MFSFELNPVTAAFLALSVVDNGVADRVHVANRGVTGDGRVLRFPRCQAENYGGQHFRFDMENLKCGSATCKKFKADYEEKMRKGLCEEMLEVPTVTFAEILEVVRRGFGGNIRFLKVDCEGCEYEIIEDIQREEKIHGFGQVMGECHPTINHRMNELCSQVLRNSGQGR